MFKLFLGWLTRSSEEAVMTGVGNAVEKLVSGEPQHLPPRLAALVAQMTPTPALPEAATVTAEEPKKTARSKSA